MKKEKFLILDSSSIFHRAFYALPHFSDKKGNPTSAIYGFLLTLFRLVNEIKPNYIAACLDTSKPTFRHKEFKLYKIKRPKTPDELVKQIPKLKEILSAFNIKIFEKEGFEADDLIATLTKKAKNKQIFPPLEIYIASNDLDCFQLIDKDVKIVSLKKKNKEDNSIYDRKRVKKELNLEPKQILDFKAIYGDPSDNIPGITGIGKKGAISLLNKFKNLDNIYKNIEKLPERTRKAFLEYKDQAYFSRSLAKLNYNVPLDFKLEDVKFDKFDKIKIERIFRELGFKSLLKKLENFNIKKRENLKLI